MPTVLLISGFRFFFYSNENNEPAHIHVVKANSTGKIWLSPTFSVAYMVGFSKKEVNEIIEIATANKSEFLKKWNEYFSK